MSRIVKSTILLISFFACGLVFAQDAAELMQISAGEARIPKPPRSVSDVLNLLERYQTKPEVINKIISVADASPPIGIDGVDLSLFYQ